MLPDLSPAHILIVVVVALIVVGPKDLPMLLRKVGQFMGKMRGMANEFRASFDEMARQSELEELRKEVEAMRTAAETATPDLGLNADLSLAGAHPMQADAYSDIWATPPAAPEPAAAPPEAGKPPKAAKTRAASTKAKPAKAQTPPKAKAKPQTKAATPAKPRAKKAKPASEAGA